jgi:hypothetical protein
MRHFVFLFLTPSSFFRIENSFIPLLKERGIEHTDNRTNYWGELVEWREGVSDSLKIKLTLGGEAVCFSQPSTPPVEIKWFQHLIIEGCLQIIK